MCSGQAAGQQSNNRSCQLIQAAVTIHTHSPILTPFLQPRFFFLPLSSICLRKSPLPPKKRMNNLVGMQGMNCWVCLLLIVSLTHRLFMWLCERWPLPFSASHPHPRVSFSPCLAGGKLELFCSGGFLREIVKAVTVWAFISQEKRRGRNDRGRGQEKGNTKGEFGHRWPC